MRKGDTQLGTPYVEYTNTKANIEALTGISEGATAYATDTDRLGTYTGAAWKWITYIPVVATDPSSPADGEMWNLRTVTGAIADGTPIGLLLALTYTGNVGSNSPLVLSVNDNGTTRRLAWV